MSTVIHRITRERKHSVNSPSYSTDVWLHNPDYTTVSGVPEKYWDLSGDTIVEKSQAEKDQIDSDDFEAAKIQKLTDLYMNMTGFMNESYSQPVQSSLNFYYNEATASGWSNRINYIQPAINRLSECLTEYYINKVQIMALPLASGAGAFDDFNLDLATLSGSDPQVQLQIAFVTVS